MRTYKGETMNKKWIILLLPVLILLFVIPVFFVEDCFDSFDLTYTGNNGLGKIEIEKLSDKDYDYLKFDINPNSNLSNGDQVLVKVKNSNIDLLKHGVILKNKEKSFTVCGLREVEYTYPYDKGEAESSEKEKKEYEEYWNKQACDDCSKGNVEIDQEEKENGTAPITKEWEQGKSKEITYKKDKDFFTVEYGNNSIETFKTANLYGENSSQQYRIEPIINPRGNVIGYSCIFNE